MKKNGLMFSLMILVIFWGVSSYAQPLPGTYKSGAPGDFLAGSWSETLVGGSEGAPGNIIHAKSDDYIFSDENGPALSEVLLIGEPGANPFYEYRTIYKGGVLTLNNGAATWSNNAGQPPSYQVNLTDTLVITKKYVDSGGAPTGEMEFALFVLDARIQGYPGFTVTLNAKFDKGTPTITPGPDSSVPTVVSGDLTWAVISIKGPTSMDVPVDIKPGSCPNPINFKSNGVIPVAILGTPTFDVTQVDPASIKLKGIAPLRWSLEDVGTPFEPYTGKDSASDCNQLGRDGIMDLSLKFDTQKLGTAIGNVSDGTVLVLELEGKLKDGTLIKGEDVVTILNKGKHRGWNW